MAKKKAAKKKEAPLRFDETLALNQWMLSLFDVGSFEQLADELRPLNREGLDENNVHRFHEAMKVLRQFEEFPGDTLHVMTKTSSNSLSDLAKGDQSSFNGSTSSICQYCSPRSTSTDPSVIPDKLLNNLNEHFKKFNADKTKKEQVPDFKSVTFVDPAGIRSLPSDDPKNLFYKTIKELQTRLGNLNVILNSFINSHAPYQEVN